MKENVSGCFFSEHSVYRALSQKISNKLSTSRQYDAKKCFEVDYVNIVLRCELTARKQLVIKAHSPGSQGVPCAIRLTLDPVSILLGKYKTLGQSGSWAEGVKFKMASKMATIS